VSTTEQQQTAVDQVAGNGDRGEAAGRAALQQYDGPSPFVVIGIAFLIGVAVAKWLDWRGHAHPR
jgi:hypothetical protein